VPRSDPGGAGGYFGALSGSAFDKAYIGHEVAYHEVLHKARLLYPTADLSLAKHHGRAEALLLGHWGLRHGT